jgi:periplasmic copper chaperone A
MKPIPPILLVAVVLTLTACSDPSTEAPGAASTITSPAPAQPTSQTQSLVISQPWARPTAPGTPVGVVYLAITNHSMNPDRLLSARSSVAGSVELHATTTDDGVMRMRPVEALEVLPHQTVALTPGGLHLMLLELAAPLVAGDRFPVTLHFETAGDIAVDVAVGDGAATTGDASTHAHP